MPYSIKKSGKEYKVVKKDTGQVVASSETLEGAKGYIYHASKGDQKR